VLQPQPTAVTTATPGLAGFLAVVQRWRWMLVAAALAAGLAGYATAAGGSPQYETQTVLLVGPLSTDKDALEAAGQLAQTYSELAITQPVLDATARRLRLSDVQASVEANASTVTRLLTITVRHNDPVLGARIANAQAAELVALAERREAERRQTDRRDTAPQAGTGRLRIVDPAEPGEAPAGPPAAAIAVLAGIVGLLGALALALLLDRSGDTVKNPQELEAATGVPCVGSLSRSALRRSRADEPVVTSEPRSRAADEYRLLAAKLSAGGHHSLLVMALDGDSAVMARNLAAALAAAGSQVALIDVDAPDEAALATPEASASGSGSSTPTARINGHGPETPAGVEVLPAPAVHAARRSGPDGARSLLESIEAEADVVLLHAPPLQRSPDGLAWARAAEGTLLLAQRDRTVTRELRAAVETLRLVHARLLGTVLAEPPAVLRR
jgi:capsular polysaccharide biosynthesis protein